MRLGYHPRMRPTLIRPVLGRGRLSFLLASMVSVVGCKAETTSGDDEAGGPDRAQPPDSDHAAAGDTGSGGSGQPKLSPAPEQVTEAGHVRLDGIGLGARFDALRKRSPYEEPCDTDALRAANRTVVVYSGRVCHDQSFPEGSSLLLLMPAGEGGDPDDLAQPVEAMAWIGGKYFSTSERSNFPVAPGASLADTHAVLGDSTKMMQIGTASEHAPHDPAREPMGAPLLAHRHAGDLWSISREEVTVGFVAGSMPEEPRSEDWDAVRQLYFAGLEPIDDG